MWLDQYKNEYYIASGLKNFTTSDVSEQKKWKEERGCHSFDWYIENLYPDIFERYPLNFTGYAHGVVRQLLNLDLFAFSDSSLYFIFFRFKVWPCPIFVSTR